MLWTAVWCEWKQIHQIHFRQMGYSDCNTLTLSRSVSVSLSLYLQLCVLSGAFSALGSRTLILSLFLLSG